MNQFWDQVKRSVDVIQDHFERDTLPATFVVLGSGFKSFVEKLENKKQLEFSKIPGWVSPRVQGHGDLLIIGHLDEKPVCVSSGRIHLYEGHLAESVVFPIRTLATMGVQNVILTNAAGSVNMDIAPGQIVVLKDHINFQGQNCLVGCPPELGPLFIDMSRCYNPEWRQRLLAAYPKVKEGVYAGVVGPSYETTAEAKMLGAMGADLVGMSTVQEAIAAHHLKLHVLGLSFVTNYAGGLGDEDLSHEDVLDIAKNHKSELQNVLLSAIYTAP